MSWWILPTTADIGIRAFSSSAVGAITECVLGLQSIQLEDKNPESLNHLTRFNGVWSVVIYNNDLIQIFTGTCANVDASVRRKQPNTINFV